MAVQPAMIKFYRHKEGQKKYQFLDFQEKKKECKRIFYRTFFSAVLDFDHLLFTFTRESTIG